MFNLNLCKSNFYNIHKQETRKLVLYILGLVSFCDSLYCMNGKKYRVMPCFDIAYSMIYSYFWN